MRITKFSGLPLCALLLWGCGGTDTVTIDTNTEAPTTIETSEDPLLRLAGREDDFDNDRDEAPGFGEDDFTREMDDLENRMRETDRDGTNETDPNRPDRVPGDREPPESTCLHGGFVGRWVDVPGRNGGVFGGIWSTRNARVRNAHVLGRYGVTAAGRRVFAGKLIERNGRYRGELRGTWNPLPNTQPRPTPAPTPNETDANRRTTDRNAGSVTDRRPDATEPARPTDRRPRPDGLFDGKWRYRSGEFGEVSGYYIRGQRPGTGSFEGGWFQVCRRPAPEPTRPDTRPTDGDRPDDTRPDGTRPNDGNTRPDDGNTRPDDGNTRPDDGNTRPDGTRPDGGDDSRPNDGNTRPNDGTRPDDSDRGDANQSGDDEEEDDSNTRRPTSTRGR